MSLVQVPIYNKNIDHSTGEIISLGTDGKSVANGGGARRELRYRLQSVAKKLLPSEGVSQCMHRCGMGGVSINVSQSSGLASFGGVVTCKSVWLCPVCSAKISNGRRKELNTVLEWSRAMGYQPVLMTLTARHGVNDSLVGLLAAMKLAKQKLHQSREWKMLAGDLVGHVTATEVTYGDHGWHVHFHVILVVAVREGSVALSMCDSLQPVWLRVLAHKDVCLSGNGYAFDVQDATKAGDYVSKWGAGEEVTLGAGKTANGKGFTPFGLLGAVATSGDFGGKEAQLFREYGAAFKGKRQLVWSRDFKGILAIVDRSDDELAEEPEADDLVEVATVTKGTWRIVCRRGLQSELLSVAEQGGGLYVQAWVLALHNQERLKNGGTSTGR